MSDNIRLYDVEQSAIESLRDRINDLIQEYEITSADQVDDDQHNELCDLIFEVTDSAVPIYTSDLMQLAADNISLATDEPEIGPAFDGSPTPVNIVAANVFEHIEQRLWEYVRDELEYDSAIRYARAKYLIEPDIPYKGDDVYLWCAYNGGGDDINPYSEEPESFWEAFKACIQHAIDSEYQSIVIEWKITDRDVSLYQEWKADRLIAKQSARNTKA